MLVEVSSHGSSIKRRHETFLISDKEGNKQEVPAEKVDCVIVSANAMVSTSAIRLCIERQIHMVISNYGGKPLARLWVSTPGRATEIRRMQYQNANTPFSFDLCRSILLKKVGRQRRLLSDLRHNRKDGENEPDFDDAIKSMSSMAGKIKEYEYAESWKQEFLGYEGSTAAQYFRCISSILPKRWKFESRSQHPAKDEFNAVLNYVYGIGYSSVEKAIIISGLDPNAGFYHADSYGKPTLSFDIIEMSRPVMDRLVVTFFTKRMVSDAWFEKDDDTYAITLTKKARYEIISKYREEYARKIEKESWEFCKQIVEDLVSMGGKK